ncbi:MAG: NAD-dependent deacylase [Methylococcaceae bacterium]|nr:NAD-dependent deacylase [Methylococcaceae bacterium]
MFDGSLLTHLHNARHIVVFTGAGVSAESGIPTFRDAQTGLWTHHDATDLASPQGFQRDPALVWGWYEWRRMKVLRAEPNPAHLAIADLAGQVERLTLVTQNVDDLHERAGSGDDIIHLHGSIHQPRCFACARPYAYPAGIPDEPEGGRRIEPPRCSHCNGRIRPGVVWFNESLPEGAWAKAKQAGGDCDVLFSVGTSSLVWPAALLPGIAAQRGATVIQVNPDETDLDDVAHYNLRGKAGELLPALLDVLRKFVP